MLSACPGDTPVIERIYKAFDDIGYAIRIPQEMHNSIYCASDFGVPQDRRRVIIFGVPKERKNGIEDFYKALDMEKITGPKKTARDAIGNLPKFRELNEPYKAGSTNVSHELIGDVRVRQHEARYHNKRDIQVFRDWGSKKMNGIPYEEKLAYYKAVSGKTSNHNKYRSLEWDKPSPTIVSHLHKDGLMFIHPDVTQVRLITIREAALLQSFPMEYEFLGSNSNEVPETNW